jgi:hypothetical protein
MAAVVMVTVPSISGSHVRKDRREVPEMKRSEEKLQRGQQDLDKDREDLANDRADLAKRMEEFIAPQRAKGPPSGQGPGDRTP